MIVWWNTIDSKRRFPAGKLADGLCRLFCHLANNSTFWQQYRDKLTCGEMFARRS
jgi:hypothetical protein